MKYLYALTTPPLHSLTIPACHGDPSMSTSPIRPNDTYWQIGATKDVRVFELKTHLQRRGFYCPHSVTKQRLHELVCRHERGLLSYDRYTTARLLDFVSARGIDVAGQLRPRLICMLEKADDDEVFDRVFDLPPELRSAIFTHHLRSLDFKTSRATSAPARPPLCRASRQLRDEALPLCYSLCTFHFVLTEDIPGDTGRRIIGGSSSTRPVFDPLWLLDTTSSADIKHMRFLH